MSFRITFLFIIYFVRIQRGGSLIKPLQEQGVVEYGLFVDASHDNSLLGIIIIERYGQSIVIIVFSLKRKISICRSNVILVVRWDTLKFLLIVFGSYQITKI